MHRDDRAYNRKQDLLDWARFNRGTLVGHDLCATAPPAPGLLADELGLDVHRFLSGPLGGDQQVGAGVEPRAAST